ncbi:hypothetical protein ATEG_08718 [Aspergillus terreus NIH2624]|uniref:Glutaminase GtaA n=1 Tax=Aspergillus terreus (strain NIH 2624 / FGSC A1156) TaxID=341663 RepID=Q0CC66_ASPTN|nr:uncharacterized protein ATEG_08718 [Aspergillus terreus NIH2624]EAU30850.1 hypothetical protein ATEG_08718 [Aspergillus terreus NIH2624]
MLVFQLLAFLVAFLVSGSGAVSSFIPARPPAIPLAVKSPYLSTWLRAGSDGGNGGYLAGEWPTFWASQITGWAGMVRVDGNVYTWMGIPGSATVNQTAFEYTSTKSIFTMEVNNAIQMNVTFLSPVTPDDLRRQSLVFSYVHVDVSSLDGKPHDVQIYSDISAEWASGNRNAIAQWDYGVTNGGVAYHKVWRQTPLLFSENSDQAEWGDWYWATDNRDGLTFQSGADVDVRGAFAKTGALPNTKDFNFRAIQNNWPVFGFAQNLGSVSESASTLFTIGLAQDQAVQYNGTANGLTSMAPLWKDFFSTALDALDFFHHDYEESESICTDLDQRIATDSLKAAGQNYLTITSLTVRQAFGAVQLCGTSGNEYLFLKEISSNGNMNTVDVIFPAYPIFLYTNPQLLTFLLKPHFEIQEGGLYPNKYSMHDIGSHFPNATGHGDGKDEEMPLEECGNMIIMALAYHHVADDAGAYIQQHYQILNQWASYLIQYALYPAEQLSTDDFAGRMTNQTNLALKGIIGIEAMSSISSIAKQDVDAQNYTAVAHSYIDQWQQLAIDKTANPPHMTLNYTSSSTYSLLYNLYADRQLGLGLVPQSVYDMQDKFYPTVKEKYGVPLDTRGTYTKADWELFVAAISSPSTRDMFLELIVKWINETPTSGALTDLYSTTNGDYPAGITHFIARPVMGGSFAQLLLEEY